MRCIEPLALPSASTPVSQGREACKSGERRCSPTILEFHPYIEALRGVRAASFDTIYQALSTGADRRGQNEVRDNFILTFLLIEARRYEHARCANRIHCR
jgi:hypothetical protein